MSERTGRTGGERVEPVMLALDAGQTGIKARVTDADGSRRDELLPGVLTDRPLAPQLSTAIDRLTGSPRPRELTVAIGLSGVTDVHAEAAALASTHRGARVIVAHDSVSSYLGVLGDRPGAVVAAGTGVVTLGVGAERAVRVDGWGYLMGDAGSGYWIGREALDAVMRAHDGRGPKTALTEVVRERWPDLESAYISLQSDDARVGVVASYAEPTTALAASGDEVALGICRRAAGELAHAAVTALRTSVAPADAVVGVTGGVFGSDLLRGAFADAVSAARPEAHLVPSAGAGLDGVSMLPALPHGHALRRLIADTAAPAVSDERTAR